jgi:hypothetical protein
MSRSLAPLVLAGALLALIAPQASAQTVTLYDAASNVTPTDPMWGWGFSGVGTVSGPSGTGAVTLNTTGSDLLQAGWGRNTPSALNPAFGYSVRFDLEVLTEDHSNPSAEKNADGLADRAGVNVIVVGSNQRGVELAFWTGEIWPQDDSPLFIHDPSSERAMVSTTSMNRYDLDVLGTGYTLRMNGAPILSGLLKDYTAGPALYSIPNALFIGDDTTSARGSFRLARVDVTAVPEPGAAALLAGSGLAAVLALAGRQRSRKPAR